jgi:hypothetical protein
VHPESPYLPPKSVLPTGHGFRIRAFIAGLATTWLGFIAIVAALIELDLALLDLRIPHVRGFWPPYLVGGLSAYVAGGFVAGRVGRPLHELHAIRVGLVASLPVLIPLVWAQLEGQDPEERIMAALFYGFVMTLMTGAALLGGWIARIRATSR